MNENDINYIYERASKRIKLFRKYRKMTQEKLSMNSTFSRGFIANIESKKTIQTFICKKRYFQRTKRTWNRRRYLNTPNTSLLHILPMKNKKEEFV